MMVMQHLISFSLHGIVKQKLPPHDFCSFLSCWEMQQSLGFSADEHMVPEFT